jgi:hypothetical protein
MSPLQVRGSGLWARREWLREHHGDDGAQRLLAELSPAGRLLWRDELDPSGWYNVPLFLEIIVALDRVFGAGDGKLSIELARDSAHRNTKTLYKAFIRLGSVGWVLGRAAKLWSEHFTEGSLVVRTEKDARMAEGEVVDFPIAHLHHTYTVLGFAIGCIEMSGEKNVRGELVSCRSRGADRTVIRVYWG